MKAILRGDAEAQGSKRLGKNKHTGKPLLLDANPETRVWRNALANEMRKTAPAIALNVPMFVKLRIFVQRPRSHYGTGRNAHLLKPSAPNYPGSGKDVDKVQRAVGDAGTGLWWYDDCRVMGWDVLRLYDDGEGPRVEVEAWAAGTRGALA